MTNSVYLKPQVDTLLAAKQNAGSLAAVASTGAYGDLSGRPTVPSTAAQVGAVPTARAVNGHALTADVTVTASDVGAAPYAQASGASAIRFIGYGSSFPTSPTVGDCFFLQAP